MFPVICSGDVVYEGRGWLLTIDPFSVEVVLSSLVRSKLKVCLRQHRSPALRGTCSE
jgi:hypothetical protein